MLAREQARHRPKVVPPVERTLEFLGDAEPDDARIEGEDVGRQARVVRVQKGIGERGRVEDILHIGLDCQIIGTVKDRKSVVSGTSVSVRVDLGGRRIIKKKKQKNNEKNI